MKAYLYILVGKKPVATKDAVQWAMWREKAECCVKSDGIGSNIFISTVFLGVDYGMALYGKVHKPLVFETQVFGGPLDGLQRRWSTWIGAEHGHQKVVEEVKKALVEHK